MPFPLRTSDNGRAEPKIAAPGPRPIAEPVPMRRAAAVQGRDAAHAVSRAPAERQTTGLTAGERLTVSSAITGGEDEPRRRPGLMRLLLVMALIVFAGIGAVTVYHSVAGAFPH